MNGSHEVALAVLIGMLFLQIGGINGELNRKWPALTNCATGLVVMLIALKWAFA